MPYGFDTNDHNIVLKNIQYPWSDFENCIPLVYAGAFLPKSDLFIDLLFRAISELKSEQNFNKNIKLFFLGTGEYSHKSIAAFAKEHNLSDEVVEIRERFPYLHVLNFLSAAKGLILLGSSEAHYTASKTFQYILSKTPIFSILHTKSTAVNILKNCHAADYLCEYDELAKKHEFYQLIKAKFRNFAALDFSYNPDLSKLEQYSAKKSAEILLSAIKKVFN